jgi:hypothetical protein
VEDRLHRLLGQAPARPDRHLTSRRLRSALLLAALLAAVGARAADRDLPWIAQIDPPARLGAGQSGELRVTYRAPRANVVAVLEAAEDLDGPATGRAMREREVSVVARTYGYRRGELVWPVAFATSGWKRVTLTLVTDERELSDPVAVELEVGP